MEEIGLEHSMEEALDAYAAGKFVIVVDDKNRENEGDLIISPENMTTDAIAFMVRHTTGIICISLTSERLEELGLPLMVPDNAALHQTAFTVSVDSRHGTTTGVSASDRAMTIRSLVHPNTKPFDLQRPGHIFPLRYCEGGVLKRAGHTEAAVDLGKLSGKYPAGVMAEIVNDDGSMARLPDLVRFAKKHRIPLISVADMIRYRRRHEKLVQRLSEARIPTHYGEFAAYVYESKLDGIQHIAMVKGDVSGRPVLVRVHSECLTGDVFGSQRCDCGQQLQLACQRIQDEECGVIIYLRGHEGRGIGLGYKLRAYTLQDQGKDTVEANLCLGLPVDSREYGIGAQMLADLGVRKMRLMTNNPAKFVGLEGYNLEIVERIPLIPPSTEENIRYLTTKKEKLGHLLGALE